MTSSDCTPLPLVAAARSDRMLRRFGLVAMAASGMAGLIDEVNWARALAYRLGTTTLASSLVIGLLVLGWGFGAWYAGRRQRPWAAAWISQCLAGIASLGMPWLALSTGDWTGLGRDALLLFGVTASAAAMGIAMPVWIGHVERGPAGRRSLGLWNGWSSTGSTLGALGAGFVLLPWGGIYIAGICAALLHFSAAAIAWTASRGEAADASPEVSADLAPPREVGSSMRRPIAIWLACLSGFVTVAAQALALRWLLLCFLGFSHVFAAVAATGLLTYAAGSFLGSWRIRSADHAARRVAFALGFAALALAAEPWILGALPGTKGSGTFASSASASWQIAGVLLHTVAFLAIPVACAAAWLPLVSAALGDTPARCAGRALFYSGLGAAIAPLLTHLVLVPALGSLNVSFLLAALLALSIAAIRQLRRSTRWIGALCGALFAALPLGTSLGDAHALYQRSPVMREHPQFRLLKAHEDAVFAVAVVDDARETERTLLTDNFRAAGTGDNYAYMSHLGSLPLLFDPLPREVLVIAFGTGTTAGTVAAHPTVKTLDIVEIAPSVLAERSAFRAVNAAVDAPAAGMQVRFHVADGRRFVEASDAQWDAITLEPLLPYAPGAVHFYTREFYALVRDHLRPRGTLTHWIPATSVPPREVRALLRTFAEAFPHAGLWIFGPSLVVVGSEHPLRFAPRENLEDEHWEEALAAFCGRDGLLELAAEPLITDAHPWIEFLGVRPSLDRLAWYRENLRMLLPRYDAQFSTQVSATWQRLPTMQSLWERRRSAQRELWDLVLEAENERFVRLCASLGEAVPLPPARAEEDRLSRFQALDERAQSAPTTRTELEQRLVGFYLRSCVERLVSAGQRATRFDDARLLLREALALAERLQRLRPQRFEAWLYAGAAHFLLSADPSIDETASRRSEALAVLAFRHAAALHPQVFEDVETQRYLDPLLAAWIPGGRAAAATHMQAARELGERIWNMELPDELATLCSWIGNAEAFDDAYFRAFRAVQVERAYWSRRIADFVPRDEEQAAFRVLQRWLPSARRK